MCSCNFSPDMTSKHITCSIILDGKQDNQCQICHTIGYRHIEKMNRCGLLFLATFHPFQIFHRTQHEIQMDRAQRNLYDCCSWFSGMSLDQNHPSQWKERLPISPMYLLTQWYLAAGLHWVKIKCWTTPPIQSVSIHHVLQT